jgi:NAD(P)-dependent dehydrogenase (short-subunit alcohol dehydrogenase family)
MTKTVLITGARGNIGAKLRAHFTELGWMLRLLDVNAGGDPAIMPADLSLWHDAWVSQFAEVDAVIHLAGRPSPRTSWTDAVMFNFDMTQNVYEAAVREGARRLIFASSNWVVAGHRFADTTMTPDIEPYPENAYGVSKLVGERLGRSYHERDGLSVICFRIGYCQHGENRPGPHMGWGSWGQLMWLSDRDLCNAMERAVLADGVGFAVLNLMSDNPGMRWDIETTKRVIGYAPCDGAAVQLTEAVRIDEATYRQLHEAAFRIKEAGASRRW